MILTVPNVCLKGLEGTCIIPLQQVGSEESEAEQKHLWIRVSKYNKGQEIARKGGGW
jgi:hypothetical protein